MTWYPMHLASMHEAHGAIPVQSNERSAGDAGARFDYENPDYRWDPPRTSGVRGGGGGAVLDR